MIRKAAINAIRALLVHVQRGDEKAVETATKIARRFGVFDDLIKELQAVLRFRAQRRQAALGRHERN